MKIVYLHGLHSSPMSYKRKVLEDMGHIVCAPYLRADDWNASLWHARSIITRVKPDVVVGSSRGGAVALAVQPDCRVLLIAPAYAKYYPEAKLSPQTHILHSANDEVIPYSDSVKLARSCKERLHQVGSSHRMNDEEAITTLIKLLPIDLLEKG